MKKLVLFLIVALLILLEANIGYAQAPDFNLAKTFGSINAEYVRDFDVDEDGNILVIGYHMGTMIIGNDTLFHDSVYNHFFLYIVKLDANLNYLWTKSYSGLNVYDLMEIEVDNVGNIYIFGGLTTIDVFCDTNSLSASGDNAFILKLDPGGNCIWSKTFDDLDMIKSTNLKIDQLGNIIINGTFSQTLLLDQYTLNSIGDDDIYLAKLDPNGNFLWAKSFGGPYFDFFNDLIIDDFGNILICGKSPAPGISFDSVNLNYSGASASYFAKFDPNGNCMWAKIYGRANSFGPAFLDLDEYGGINIVIGISSNFDNGTTTYTSAQNDIYIGKYNYNGDLLWANAIVGVGPDFNFAEGIVSDIEGNSYLTGGFKDVITVKGETLISNNGSWDAFILKLDFTGNIIWIKSIGSIGYEKIDQLSLDNQNNLVIAGVISDTVNLDSIPLTSNGGTDIIVAKLNNGPLNYQNLPSALISGKTYYEANGNCDLDTNEIFLPNKIIKAMPGNYYAITNAQGDYNLSVPMGSSPINYVVSAVHSNTFAYQTATICPLNSVHTIPVGSFPDTIVEKDFGCQLLSCHWLEVQLASNRRRICSHNTTTLTYSNLGSITAANAYIVIDFPKYVVPVSSSIPWVYINDSTYQFNLGDVASGQIGTITIIDSVKCGLPGINGMAQCTKATIYPVPNCPSANWNGAEIGIAGRCENGFVMLDIFNKGTANMNDSIEYEVHIDSVSVFSAKTMLNAGDTVHLQALANGHSVHMYANQVAFHPTSLFASLTIESCSNDSTFVPSAYVNHFPLAQAPNSKTHCLPIISSIDPNDKQVFPMGFTANHIIAPGTALEYLIRFQNTGTDTAFVVTISDTLSQYLNPETFEMGAASHPYQLSMQTSANGKTALRWQFNHINLPDSNTNLLASQGFIQFRISPKDSLPLGTTVFNDAAIYFDFNPPIITNQTLITYDNISFTDSTLIGAVNIIPNKPALIYPSNLSSNIPTIVTFDWNDVPFATWYQLEYDTDMNFSTAQGDTSALSEYNLASNLNDLTTYYWRVKSFNGNSISSAWSGTYSFTTDFTTSINQKKDTKILIYPNPAHDGLNITLPEIDDVQIEITDLSARVVLSQKVLHQSNIYLPLYLAQGMYQLRIIGAQSNSVSRLMVK